jgi:hypothetical protein
MIISHFDRAARKLLGPFAVLGVVGGLVTVAAEAYGVSNFSVPAVERRYELISHGHHFWVSAQFWWFHAIAQWVFFSLGGLIILLELTRGLYLFWKNAWS